MITVDTKQTILERMINNIIAQPNSKVTYFGPGPARAILSAISTEVQSLYLAMAELDRAWDVEKAVGEDLDRLGAQRGLVRYGPRSASVVARVVLQRTTDGVPSTPTVTALQAVSSNGVSFQFTGSEPFRIPNNGTGARYSYANIVMQADSTGPSGNIPLGTLTSVISQSFAIPADHILLITNTSPGQGGADTEPDEEFRKRIIDKPNINALGVEPFYLSVIREIDPSVIRIKLSGISATGSGVTINYLRDSATALSSSSELAIKNTITELLPVGTANVVLSQIPTTAIDFFIEATLVNSTEYTPELVIQNIAEALVDYLNWSEWSFDTRVVPRDELLSIINGVEGVDLLNTVSFVPSNDYTLDGLSLPRVGNITLKVGNTTTTAGNISTTYPSV